MFPLPTQFNERFNSLSSSQKDQIRGLLDESRQSLSNDDLTFAQYTDAHLTVEENGWEKKDIQTVVDGLIELTHKGDDSVLSAGMMLWILVEELGRKEIAKKLLTRKTWLSDSFKEVFPYISFDVQDLQEILAPLSKEIRGDGAAFIFYDIMQKWARLHAQEAIKYFEAERNNIPIDFALEILKGLIEAKELEVVVAYFHDWVGLRGQPKYLALHLLPTLYDRKAITLGRALNYVADHLKDEDVKVTDAALFALRWLAEEKVTARMLKLLRDAIHDSRNEIKWRISRIIWTCKKPEIEALGVDFLQTVTDLDTNLLEIVKNTDYVLSHYAESAPETVEGFLKEWVTQHKHDEPSLLVQRKRFHHTFHTLRSHHPNFIREFGTRWMLLNAPLAKAGAFLMDKFESPDFELAQLLHVGDEEFKCIAERVLSCCFDPQRRFTLLQSLFPIGSSNSRLTLLKDAFEELTFNYPGAAERFANSLASDDEIGNHVKQVIDHVFSTYYEPCANRPELKEFYPSPGRVETYNRFQNKKQAEANKAIDESGEFVFRQLVTKINIGRGDAWVATRPDGTADEPSKFASFSYGTELPRLEILDPDVEAYKRLIRIHRLKPSE